jgi:hypothetical protein
MARTPKIAPAPPVAEVVDPAEVTARELVATAHGTIAQFFAGLVPFFRKAGELEDEAGALLAHARTLTVPTSQAEDFALQEHVRKSRAVGKDIAEHWSPRKVFFDLNKRMIAGEQKAALLAATSAETAQKLHNAFVEAESRRVREFQRQEQARLDREAEDARQREIDEMEAAAAKAEAESPELSDREAAYVAARARGVAAEFAVKGAGFKGDAFRTAARLESNQKIAAAIVAATKAAAIRSQAAAVKAQPIEAPIAAVPESQAVTKGDRVTWSAEVTDEQALIAAVIAGKHGIPWDILQVNPARLNTYARDMRTALNRWPGVRATERRGTV